MSQYSMSAFLHCASAGTDGGRSMGRSTANLAEICWPAPEEAEPVIKFEVDLHFSVNIKEWMQASASNISHMDKSRYTNGVISAQTSLLQFFVDVIENYIALGEVMDGTKLGNMRPINIPARTCDRPVMGTRHYEVLQRSRQISEQIAEYERERRGGGEGSSSSSSSSSSSGRQQEDGDEVMVTDPEDVFAVTLARLRSTEPVALPTGRGGGREQRPDASRAEEEVEVDPELARLRAEQEHLDLQIYRNVCQSTEFIPGGELAPPPAPGDDTGDDGQPAHNPFKKVNPDAPLMRFLCELVMKDPTVIAGGQAQDKATVNGTFDPETGQVHRADINDLIALFHHLEKRFKDPEALDLCQKNISLFEKLSEMHGTAPDVQLPPGVKPYRLIDHIEEVDSFMLSFFTTLGFDPATIARDIIIHATKRASESPSATLSSLTFDAVSRQDEWLAMPKSKQARMHGARDDDGGIALFFGMDKGGDRRQSLRRMSNSKRQQMADQIQGLLAGVDGMTLDRYMLVSALYCNDASMWREWSARQRSAIDGVSDPASKFHICNVFSLGHAMQQRSEECCYEQSLARFVKFLQRAIVEPGCDEVVNNYLYTDHIPNRAGEYSFVYPMPERVMMYNLSAVKASQFLTYPLPHKAMEVKHPLIERCPALCDHMAGQMPTRRWLHNIDIEDESLTPERRRRLIEHQQSLCISNNANDYIMASMQKGIREDQLNLRLEAMARASDTIPFQIQDPFDLRKLTSSSIQSAVQELVRRAPAEGEVSHVETAIEMSQSMTGAVKSAVQNVKGSKRRMALLYAHRRAMLDLYEAECDPYLPDSDAFQAIQWCKMNDQIHSGARRIKPPRMAPHLPAYANMLILMSAYNYHVLGSAYPHEVTKTFMAALSAADCSKELKLNMTYVGDGEGGKSKTARITTRMLVGAPENKRATPTEAEGVIAAPSTKSTVERLVSKTQNSTSSAQTWLMDHKVWFQEEVAEADVMGSSGGGSGGSNQKDISTNSQEKDIRTSCECVRWRLTYDGKTGKAVLSKYYMMLRVMRLDIWNFSILNLEDSWLSRTLFIVFPKEKPGETTQVSRAMLRTEMPGIQFAPGEVAAVRIEDVRRMYNELHVFTADLFNLVEMGALDPINQCVAFLIVVHLDNWMRMNGGTGLGARQISMIITMARLLMIGDIYAAEVLFPGGRVYGQDWTLKDYLKINPMLYIRPDHVYTALGMLYTHMCTQGREELSYTVRDHFVELVDELLLSSFCPKDTEANVHYFLTDHIFAQSAGTARDRAKAERSFGASGSGSGAGAGGGGGDSKEKETAEANRILDYHNKDYGFYNLDYVWIKIPTHGLREICDYLCNRMQNVPEVKMVLPVRSFTANLDKLMHTSIRAYPMKANSTEKLKPGQKYGLVRDEFTVPLVVPTNKNQKSVPICRMYNGRLQVSTYFLQYDIPNEELMKRAIRALNNHANEEAAHDILYGQHDIKPHFSTLKIGRFVIPETGEVNELLEKNPAAYRNLRMPNPSQMNQSVQDMLMGAASVGMSPQQQRERAELLAKYHGSPVLATMLQEFETKLRVQERRRQREMAQMAPEFMDTARTDLEVELGRPLEEGEFQEELRTCALYAQTQASLLNQEQMDSAKMEITCPLSDLARQMRMQQIGMCQETITPSDVEFAVDHFPEWYARTKIGASIELSQEEMVRFGPWDNGTGVLTGIASLDRLARGAVRSPKGKEPQEEEEVAFNMDTVTAALDATAYRLQAEPILQQAHETIKANEEKRRRNINGTRIKETRMIYDPVTELECLEIEMVPAGPDGDETPSGDNDVVMSAPVVVVDADADDDDDAMMAKIDEEEAANRDKKLKKADDDILERDLKAYSQLKLTHADNIIVTPCDWLHDVQMPPNEFCVPNPYARGAKAGVSARNPFYNPRFAPHWTLMGDPSTGITDQSISRRHLFKLYYAYGGQWLLDRANLYDPGKSLHKQRSNYPQYLIQKTPPVALEAQKLAREERIKFQRQRQRQEEKLQKVGVVATSFSNPMVASYAARIAKQLEEIKGRAGGGPGFARPGVPSPKRGSQGAHSPLAGITKPV